MFCGERLKQARLDSGKSQKEVATLTGITLGAITNYECSRREPDRDTIKKFCDLFGVEYEYFFDDVEVDPVRQLLNSLKREGILKDAEDVSGDVAALILDTVKSEIRLNKLKKEQGK
jgi:transcriptional regulator with XRE-family HTH domain